MQSSKLNEEEFGGGRNKPAFLVARDFAARQIQCALQNLGEERDCWQSTIHGESWLYVVFVMELSPASSSMLSPPCPTRKRLLISLCFCAPFILLLRHSRIVPNIFPSLLARVKIFSQGLMFKNNMPLTERINTSFFNTFLMSIYFSSMLIWTNHLFL